jgi:hypothetical protein
MKHVIILLDGMADYPIPALCDKTPLEYARTPHMDKMFQKGTGGMVKNVPDSLAPGSAVANLSVLGYDPEKYFTGRSPIEAASMGVPLKDTDIAARCNLITLSDEPIYEDKTPKLLFHPYQRVHGNGYRLCKVLLNPNAVLDNLRILVWCRHPFSRELTLSILFQDI